MSLVTRAVTPADLRQAVRQVRRLGNDAALHHLERLEPELTELLLVEASHLHQQLIDLYLPLSRVRRLNRRIENLGVVLVLAARLAHQRSLTPALPVPPL